MVARRRVAVSQEQRRALDRIFCSAGGGYWLSVAKRGFELEFEQEPRLKAWRSANIKRATWVKCGRVGSPPEIPPTVPKVHEAVGIARSEWSTLRTVLLAIVDGEIPAGDLLPILESSGPHVAARILRESRASGSVPAVEGGVPLTPQQAKVIEGVESLLAGLLYAASSIREMPLEVLTESQRERLCEELLSASGEIKRTARRVVRVQQPNERR